MAITKINTRVQLKFDTWANWNSTAGKAFIPLKGEVCVCEIPKNTAATGEVIAEKAYLIKVGDGATTFGSLPWLSAQAADVHAWAKKSEADFKTWLTSSSGPQLATQSEVEAVKTTINNLDYSSTNLTATETATTTITDVSQSNGKISAVKKNLPSAEDPKAAGESITFIDTIKQDYGKITATKKTIPGGSPNGPGIVKLGGSGGAATYEKVNELASEVSTIQTKISNAMHFLGITTTSLSDGATTATITLKTGNTTKQVTLTSADAGAVVLTAAPSSSGIQYEYVWTGSAWGQLGQEGSFAVKGSITNDDISDEAKIEPMKVLPVLGTGTDSSLQTDIVDLDKRLDQAESNVAALQTATGTTLPNAIQNAVDTLGASLAGTGSASKTISSITYNKSTNKATITYSDITSASTGAPGIVQLTNSISSNTGTLAASDKAVKTAYDKANGAASNASAALNELKLTWQTSAITAVNSTNTPGSIAGTAKATGSTTGISPLNIAEQDISYIIFDCGSSTTNI